MKKLRPKDRAIAADRAAIASSNWFVLIQFIGRSGYETGPISATAQRHRWDFKAEEHGSGEAALEAARRERSALPPDPYGRKPAIYAVTANGLSVFVE